MTNIREGAMNIKDKDLEKVSGGARVLRTNNPACENYERREGKSNIRMCNFCVYFELSESLKEGQSPGGLPAPNLGICRYPEPQTDK